MKSMWFLLFLVSTLTGSACAGPVSWFCRLFQRHIVQADEDNPLARALAEAAAARAAQGPQEPAGQTLSDYYRTERDRSQSLPDEPVPVRVVNNVRLTNRRVQVRLDDRGKIHIVPVDGGGSIPISALVNWNLRLGETTIPGPTLRSRLQLGAPAIEMDLSGIQRVERSGFLVSIPAGGFRIIDSFDLSVLVQPNDIAHRAQSGQILNYDTDARLRPPG